MQRALILCAAIAMLDAGSGSQEIADTTRVSLGTFQGGRGGGGGPAGGDSREIGDPGSKRVWPSTAAAGLVMGLRGGASRGDSKPAQRGGAGWRGGGRRGGRGGRGRGAASKGPGVRKPLPYGPQSSPLEDFLGEEVHVAFDGGREMRGILSGYDHLGNLVMDNTTEYLMEEGEDDEPIWTGRTRKGVSSAQSPCSSPLTNF